MMVQQLPVGVSGPTVKTVMLGPGSLIHAGILQREIQQYMTGGQRLVIHEHAAVVRDDHAEREKSLGMTKIGSTTKGVGAAMVDRIMRDPDSKAVARLGFANHPLGQFVVDKFEYDRILNESRTLLVEGAQGFGLSLYHGDWPYCTSRDVTPWQIAADCGLPFVWAPAITIWMVARTFPIRVNNRDGTSGPAYPGQKEISWGDLGREPELTTVTKLPRRIFEFSDVQYQHAMLHCAGLSTKTVLTFADYCNEDTLTDIIRRMHKTGWGPDYLCFGPDDADIREIDYADF